MRRAARSCLSAFGELVVVLRNAKHSLFGFFVGHFFRKPPQFLGAVAPVHRIIDKGCWHRSGHLTLPCFPIPLQNTKLPNTPPQALPSYALHAEDRWNASP